MIQVYSPQKRWAEEKEPPFILLWTEIIIKRYVMVLQLFLEKIYIFVVIYLQIFTVLFLISIKTFQTLKSLNFANMYSSNI